MFEVKMAVSASGEKYAAGMAVGIEENQFLVSAEGFGIELPKDFDMDANEKAELLERRLSRVEQALGLEPTCDR